MKAKKKAKLDINDKGTLIAGIDVGKKKHYCRFINLRGYEIGKVFSFCNNRDGMEKLIEKIEQAKEGNNLTKAVIVLEPSGHYWKAAAHCLSGKGYDKVILAVGGAPVTRDLADRYGIEIYADDASSAAKEFVKTVEGSVQ